MVKNTCLKNQKSNPMMKMEINFSYLISFRSSPELKKKIDDIARYHHCDSSTAIRIALINYSNLLKVYEKKPLLKKEIKKQLMRIL